MVVILLVALPGLSVACCALDDDCGIVPDEHEQDGSCCAGSDCSRLSAKNTPLSNLHLTAAAVSPSPPVNLSTVQSPASPAARHLPRLLS